MVACGFFRRWGGEEGLRILRELKHQSQQPGRVPRRSRQCLLRRPRRRCCQRQEVLQTLGGAKASVLLSVRYRRRGRSLEAPVQVSEEGQVARGPWGPRANPISSRWSAACLPLGSRGSLAKFNCWKAESMHVEYKTVDLAWEHLSDWTNKFVFDRNSCVVLNTKPCSSECLYHHH
jgi:hypothetical protein